jgi:transposase
MQRRKFSSKYKIEAVRLVLKRGVSVTQASRGIPRERSSQAGERVRRGSNAGVSRTRSDEARAAGDRPARREVAKLKAERDILKKAAATSRTVDMKFGFTANHRSVWPVAWLYPGLGVSRSGFQAWLKRGPF